MAYLYLILSLSALAIGHYVKMQRWSKFIEIYELPNKGNLLRSLSVGHLLNYFIPYHLGDIFRVVWSGRKMKNGVGFSLATIIVEHFIDVLVVSAMFVFMHFVGVTLPMRTFILYGIIIVCVIPLTVLLVKYNRLPKLALKAIAGIFNEKINLWLLYFFWALISAFRDMYKRISIWRIALWTVFMWCAYVVSYWCIAESLSVFSGDLYRLRDVFSLMFSASSMRGVFAYDYGVIISSQNLLLFSTYLLLPLILIFVFSYIYTEKVSEDKDECMQLLPQVDERDRLNFLEAFFSDKESFRYRRFLELNKNVFILQDLSAGSNATTMLCTDGQQTFYRKYAFGSDGEKLWQQVKWLQDAAPRLSVSQVIRSKYQDNLCCYDMPYLTLSVGFFQYIHSNPSDVSWNLLRTILDDLNRSLYTNKRQASENMVNAYVERKMRDNLTRIYETTLYKSLSRYDTVVINGAEYRNLSKIASLLDPSHLKEIFKDECVVRIHGDLTIENIVCLLPHNDSHSYYLIDPNTGNILDSELLDYAKLMQSLHGGYEFMMKTKDVRMTGNRIDFPVIRSSAYDYLYGRLRDYIVEHYGERGLKKVYYHELAHWLRLMPYKIKHDSERLPMFYAGLIKTINEIDTEFS